MPLLGRMISSWRPSTVPRVLFRDFHSSQVSFKRRTGSSALDPLPRAFSKKQIKRRQVLRQKKAERYNPKTAKLKERHLERQLQSGRVDKLLESTTEDMFEAVREAMLPDGYQGNRSEESSSKLEFDPDKVMRYLRSVTHVRASKGNTSTSQIEVSRNEPDPVAINRAVVSFAKQNKLEQAQDLLKLMKESTVQLNQHSYTALISAATRSKQFELGDSYFDEMVRSGIEPNAFTWTAIINNKASSGRIAEAVKVIDQLIKIGVKVTSPMFNCVLKAYIDHHQYDEANELWLRMHDEGVEFTVDDFSLMMKLCARTRSPERAMFYIDEMKSFDLQPNTYVFNGLFRACAEAPHWVKGYEDFITDAMCVMEGCEIAPTSEIYNSIIFAFAKAGNPVAAEFYFWEMRRKGLEQSTVTYSNLISAFAWSQSVGAQRYGRLGTFVRAPLYKSPTKDQEDLMIVPPAKVGGLSKFS